MIASRLGDLAGMVITLSRAVEQLASDPDEEERHQVAVHMRALRAVFAEWGVDPQDL